MFSFLKNLLRDQNVTDYKQLMRQGAIIIDVRTENEFATGHIVGSLNISLGELNTSIPKLSKTQSIIVCCASGMRSVTARNILKGHGFNNVVNGGGWRKLQEKL